MAKTVRVIGNDPSTITMFANAGWNCYDEHVDLVCFTGGADVSPELYCAPNEHSSNNVHRDIMEVGQYLKYLRMGVQMVGICRGGQFLNVMQGGSMIQHLRNPHYGRKAMIHLFDGKERFIRDVSLHEDHHQGMLPASHGTVLGIDVADKNVEIILYPGILCFQAHPEWGHDTTRNVFFELLRENLGVSA